MNTSMELALYRDDDLLRLEVTNNGKGVQRLWEQNNSWGWGMPRILISNESKQTCFLLSPRRRVWTRNGPAFIELKPGHSISYLLTATDFRTDELQAAQSLADSPLFITAELRCDTSPEQEAEAVFAGVLRSTPQLWQPPHRWLEIPANASNEDKS